VSRSFSVLWKKEWMPIYEYECKRCRHQFECLLLPGSSDTPRCPTCGGVDLDRLLSGFAVSSAELSSARVEVARKQIARSKDTTDKRVAQSEYEKLHRDH
jgi:putative FmdB family regulatory protein